jgi:tetratricopeptide (TPR) repeat protein
MSKGLFVKLAGAGLLLAAIVVCGGGFGLPALGEAPDDAQELQDLRFAVKLFQDMHYPLAETSFGDFLAKYTNSPRRADAILYQARARLEQSNFNGAISQLQNSLAGAGGLRPEYVFWIAKARFAAGDLTGAEEGYATVARDFPLSTRRLEASYDEAEVHSLKGDWPGVTRLLRQTNGPFQLAANADGKSKFAALGWLLLGEALLYEQRPDEGEKVVLGLDAAVLTPDLSWRRQYLLCRLQLAGGRAEAALASSTNLLKTDLDPPRQASGFFLQGEILEKLGRTNDALEVYAKNLADTQPPEAQRQALARTIQLTVAMNPLPQAIQMLDTLVGQRSPQAPALDLGRLSLGELYLKAASNAPATPDTNLLAGALTNLNMVISNYTNSPLLAKARLDRGWCDWLSTNIPAAQVDFGEAAAQLPFGLDQAVARFKLADAQFLLTNYSGAASNYALVLTLYNKLPEVTNALFDLALYQIAEADFHRGDTNGACAAVEKILQWYPGSYYGDRGSLLMGEADLNRKDNYAKARAVFAGALERSPHSPFLPKVQYAIARTYDDEGDWKTAIRKYQEWESTHASDPLLPEVEFHRVLACGKAGLTNDALTGFTNFMAHFPSNALAPWALNWVADYYYNQKDFSQAERNYQKLFQTYPWTGDLAYQARFWAGRAALANQETKDATDYFTNLVSFTNARPELLARGYFALGDIFFQQFQASQKLEDLNQAMAALTPFTNGAPTNAIAVEALGRLGDYNMAWADKHGTNTLPIARQIYETIVNFPPGSISPAARCQAEVGLGGVAEKERRLELALKHYCNVVDNKYGPGNIDPYWVERAGEFAARICEDQRRWSEAVAVYERVQETVPALRPLLEKKIVAAQARLQSSAKRAYIIFKSVAAISEGVAAMPMPA